MSLLDSIKSKRRHLRETETIVTRLDGIKYKESKDNTVEVIGSTSGFVVDTNPDKTPAKILENLYLGSQDCCEYDVLQNYSIKSVLSVGIDAPQKHPRVTYRFVECLDLPETDLNRVLRDSIDFIDFYLDKNENVLVHCNAGVSRSTSVVIGYLIVRKGFTYGMSYELCKAARNCIKPNAGFERQLKFLQK